MVRMRDAVARHWLLRKLATASILCGSLISLVLLAQEAAPTKGGDGNPENGRHLYGMNCQQCHGADGDDLHCQEMVPLAGLNRRPRVGLVVLAFSSSYFFRGVSYQGADARDLTAFLVSLKGEKGFDDPGLRCPPRVLRKRFGLLDAYRVIDVRDAAAYAKGHIPNAVSWTAGEERGQQPSDEADFVQQKLGSLAVVPAMTIVIYDESVTPVAARSWWDLVRTGHPNVAILDGGLRGWADEDGYLTTVTTPVAPSAYVAPKAEEVTAVRSERDFPVLRFKAGLPQPSSGVFDWERGVVDGELRSAAEIREYLRQSEIKFPGAYRVEGSDAEASFLVYVLRLLGYRRAYYDSVSKLLIVASYYGCGRTPPTSTLSEPRQQ